MRLAATASAAGVRLIACDELGSTNAEALQRARDGETGPLWITARRQSAGRGRRGRVWTSPEGNLHATLLLTDPAPAGEAAQLSFVAALAAHDAVSQVAAQCGPLLALKWPNDLLLGGAKLGGILIEGEGSGAAFAAAIGIGLNCVHHPDDTPYPATDLASAGATVGAETLFAALSAAMLQRLGEWRRGENFAAIRHAWLARAAGRGGEIRVAAGNRDLAGIFESLDDAGRLQLRRPDGTLETIAAGEVMPLAGASAIALAR